MQAFLVEFLGICLIKQTKPLLSLTSPISKNHLASNIQVITDGLVRLK